MVATIWVLDDPRWRVDPSRPAYASTVRLEDGVTVEPSARAADEVDRLVPRAPEHR